MAQNSWWKIVCRLFEDYLAKININISGHGIFLKIEIISVPNSMYFSEEYNSVKFKSLSNSDFH